VRERLHPVQSFTRCYVEHAFIRPGECNVRRLSRHFDGTEILTGPVERLDAGRARDKQAAIPIDRQSVSAALLTCFQIAQLNERALIGDRAVALDIECEYGVANGVIDNQRFAIERRVESIPLRACQEDVAVDERDAIQMRAAPRGPALRGIVAAVRLAAEPLILGAIEQEKLRDPFSETLAFYLATLGKLHAAAKRPQTAAALYEQSVSLFEERHRGSAQYPKVLTAYANLIKNQNPSRSKELKRRIESTRTRQ